MTLADIHARELAIAEREGIPFDRIDRCWVRQQAIKSLSQQRQAIPVLGDDAISQAFESARRTIVKLEEERQAWTDNWRPSDQGDV